MRLVAKLNSYLFHPIFAPLVSIYLLFELPIYLNYKYNQTYQHYVYAIIGLNLIIIPLLINLYLKKKKMISNLSMPNVNERVLPYLISCIFFTLTFFLLKEINFPDFYLKVFQAACLSVLTLLVLALLRQKISAHMVGLGGIIGMLSLVSIFFGLDLSILLVILFLIAGLTGSSRLYLNAHNLAQVFIGFAVGFAWQWLSQLLL